MNCIGDPQPIPNALSLRQSTVQHIRMRLGFSRGPKSPNDWFSLSISSIEDPRDLHLGIKHTHIATHARGDMEACPRHYNAPRKINQYSTLHLPDQWIKAFLKVCSTNFV